MAVWQWKIFIFHLKEQSIGIQSSINSINHHTFSSFTLTKLKQLLFLDSCPHRPNRWGVSATDGLGLAFASEVLASGTCQEWRRQLWIYNKLANHGTLATLDVHANV
jgi:hypothetical protein